MFHIVYQTTCLVNQKFYVGIHSTTDLNDCYLGSGKALKAAIKKYGKENFKREILHFCESREDIKELEKQIVNKEFVNRRDTYNMITGGNVLIDTSLNGNHLRGKSYIEVYGVEKTNKIINQRRQRIYQTMKEGKLNSKGSNNPMHSTKVSKEKRKQINENITKGRLLKGASKGSKNGRCIPRILTYPDGSEVLLNGNARDTLKSLGTVICRELYNILKGLRTEPYMGYYIRLA